MEIINKPELGKDTFDLAAYLRKPSTEKFPVNNQVKSEATADTATKSDNGPVEEEIEPISDKPPVFREPAKGEPVIKNEPASGSTTASADDDDINGEEMAEAITDLAEQLLEIGFIEAFRASSFSKQDKMHLRHLKHDYIKHKHMNFETLTVYEKWLLDKDIELDEYEENTLPMEPDEKEKLLKRVRKVLGKMNFKATPEKALMFSALMYMVPRTLPIVANFIERRNDKPAFEISKSDKKEAA